ncbi:hypothetical protein [Mesoflavibacter zeaxanthinifaciens]|uniref:hypothetical protein n=1 Tax=Mesoflavibacter zeaxanthinifaciens TaxID=393060 RepID=UPI003A8D7BC5
MKALKILLITLFFTFSLNVSAQTVYTTKTGEKYHKSTCRYLKYSKKEITLKKAKELGYAACKVCKPTQKVDNSSTSTKSNVSSSTQQKSSQTTSKKTVATQCIGKTKSGSRCKRMTKAANGRCYQH